MSSLSDRVYNILMENSKRKVYERPTVNIGGAIRNWNEPKNTVYDVEYTSDERYKPRRRMKLHNKFQDIDEYDIENEAEPIDYMESPQAAGGLVGGYCYHCGGSNGVYKMSNTRKKACKTNNNGLMYYNKCLKHIKDKGYSHNEAKEILKQIKEEYNDEYFSGGSSAGWRKFWNTLKDIGKVVLPIVPALL